MSSSRRATSSVSKVSTSRCKIRRAPSLKNDADNEFCFTVVGGMVRQTQVHLAPTVRQADPERLQRLLAVKPSFLSFSLLIDHAIHFDSVLSLALFIPAVFLLMGAFL